MVMENTKSYTVEEVKDTIDGIFEWAKTTAGTKELLDETFLEGVGTSAFDWFVFAAARSGYPAEYETYREALEQSIARKYVTKTEKLGKATQWHRSALVLSAIGGDPQSVMDMDGEKTINLIADGTYDRGKTEPLDTQGLNGLIWGLITLDSADYEVPENAYESREEILQQILDAQQEDGGFALSEKSGDSDVDITAMALTALAPYYEDEKVKETADHALEWLSEMQQEDGGFSSSMEGEESSESCAQVLTALSSLGIKIEDERFVKGEKTVLDALMRFKQEDGGFVHTYAYDPENPASIPDESDLLAGGQAAYALNAYCRCETGESRLFDLREANHAEKSVLLPIVTVVFVLFAGAAGLFSYRQKNKKKEKGFV